MVYQSRARKRVHAIRRGPDGSAFQKCESCGHTVAIALFDMHGCGFEKNKKQKLKTQCGNQNVNRERIPDQPRSAFHLFMEEFMKTCEDGNEIEIDKKGCEKWKNMSKEERLPFFLQADKLNSAYVKLLLEEENEIQRVDDEADSAEVGKYNENYKTHFYGSESSGGSGLFLSETYDTSDLYFRYKRFKNLVED